MLEVGSRSCEMRRVGGVYSVLIEESHLRGLKLVETLQQSLDDFDPLLQPADEAELGVFPRDANCDGGELHNRMFIYSRLLYLMISARGSAVKMENNYSTGHGIGIFLGCIPEPCTFAVNH